MIHIDIRARLGRFALEAAFDVPTDGVTALFGRSGAGKTSILNAVAGLLQPTAGRIAIDDVTFFDSTARIDVPIPQRRLGVVFQDGRLFPHLTVRANLLYGAPRDPTLTAEPPSFDDVVALLGLSPLLDRRPPGLSGGERQRVAIGRALLMKPQALLMDEPLAALDGARKAEVLPMLAELRALRRVPIVYVSHQMDEVVRLADTLVLVSDGQIAAVGPVEDLTSRIDLRPLTGRHEAGAVLRGRVASIEPEWGLALIELGQQTFTVPATDLAVGQGLRVRIRARDVAIAVTPPSATSVLNALAGTIVNIAATDGPHVDIRISLLDGQHLWARITRKSAAALRLEEGCPVYALVKAGAIDRHSLGPPPGSEDEPA
ncbi:molybdenum ABC transporter ATP-binding protein [Thalassobaculum sp.]|uniref:molybdenum ABC transporter ATP-binding protein n=1 Tax=Thalassobaculum sp. TaxID=2022740 RepID=UPI0032EADE15